MSSLQRSSTTSTPSGTPTNTMRQEQSPAQGSSSQSIPAQQHESISGGTIHPPHRQPSGGLNPRSCIVCRKRKVRCDKAQPCSNCVRAQIPCQFPAPGRAPRRPRKPPDSELLARLRKLEGVVKNLGADAGDDLVLPSDRLTDQPISTEPMDTTGSERDRTRVAEEHSDRARGSINSSMGRLVLDEGKSRYVSNSFWANLSAEVDDLKGFLHEDSDEEGSSIGSPALSPVSEDQAFIFHHASPSRDTPLVHPPPDLIETYWQSFVENVDPLTKILHLPIMRKHVDTCKTNPEKLSKGLEALMFSMYYAAVSSMSDVECMSLVGEKDKVLISTYRRSAERALARANFLISEELVVMQAFFLFMLTLRRYEDPRVLWTLMGLLVRIAITMGLHRDGSVFNLPLFDAEMRRRIWWQIVNLDIRLAEDHGSDVTILELLSDTRFPMNIHDKTWQPDMTSTTKDEHGVTEMSFSLIRFEVSHLLRRLQYVPPPKRNPEESAADPTVKDKERWVEDFQKSLEEKYLRYCDMSVPMHWVISTMSHVIFCKLWLTIYQPFQRLDGGAGLPQQTRDRLFDASLHCLEYSTSMENEIRMEKWIWLFKSISHWHALAYLLNELCHRTRGPLVERAWRVVEVAVASWSARLSHQKKDHLWRPLKKLMNKARCARERELAHDQATVKSEGYTEGTHPGVRSKSFNEANGSNSAHTALGRNGPSGSGSTGRLALTYGVGAVTNPTSLSSVSRASRPDPYSPAWTSLPESKTSPAQAASAGGNLQDKSSISSQSRPAQLPGRSTQWSDPSSNIPASNTSDINWTNGTFPTNTSRFELDPPGKFHQPQLPNLQQTQAGFTMPLRSSQDDVALSSSFQNNNGNQQIFAPAYDANMTTNPASVPPNNASTRFPTSSQRGLQQQQSQAQSQSQPQLPNFDDPMVSGADIDLDGQNWADWGEMIREFEMDDAVQPSPGLDRGFGDTFGSGNGPFGSPVPAADTGQGNDPATAQGQEQGTSASMGTGFGAGVGMGMGMGMGVGNNMSMSGVNMGNNMSMGDGNGATLQKVGSNQRRARMGDSWFWL